MGKPKESFSAHIKERLRRLGFVGASALIDGGFITLWIVMNWGVDTFVAGRAPLSGAAELYRQIFEYFFGGATLCAVVLFILEDIIVMAKKTWKRIKSTWRS